MQIVLHCGAHATDEDAIQGVLRRNAAMLSEHGVAVPDPALYRGPLHEALQFMRTGSGQDETGFDLAKLPGVDGARRVILSHAGFLGIPSRIVEGGALYPVARRRLEQIGALFPQARLSLALALRDPADFLIGAWALQSDMTEEEFVERLPAPGPFWPKLVASLQEALPGQEIVLWRHEDLPALWPLVIGELTGLGADMDYPGAEELVAPALSENGRARLARYLEEKPPLGLAQRRRILEVFLEKAPARTDAPATEGMAARIAAMGPWPYEADMAALGDMPGVRLLGA